MNLLTRMMGTALSTTSNPADWFVDWVRGGPATVSGEAVNASSALALGAYFGGLRAISEDSAKLPFNVYEKVPGRGKRGKRLRDDHPAFTLIHDAPNPEMSAMAFREALTSHAMGWGGGFAGITRLRNGKPAEMRVIEPNRVRIERTDAGALRYNVTGGRGEPDRVISPENMIHLHGLGFDGLTGYSIARLARETIGSGIAEIKSGAALFGNGSRPGGVLETPNKLDKEAQGDLRDGWERIHGGADNANKTAVLTQGTVFKPISIPSKDAQWIESKQHTVEEIARWFRIPPHKLQHLLRATFSNIEMQSIEYVTDTLMPWLVRWEQEVKRKLLGLPSDKGLFAEHLVMGILRGDTKSRNEAHAIGRQWGWTSANDVRALENQNGIGPKGDIYLVPMNMVPAERMLDGDWPPKAPPPAKTDDSDAKPDDTKENPALRAVIADEVRRVSRETRSPTEIVNGIVEAHKPLLCDVFDRLHRLESDRIGAARKRIDFKKWRDKFAAEHPKHVRAALIPPVESFIASAWAVARGGEVPEDVLCAVAGATQEIADGHAERLFDAEGACSEKFDSATLSDAVLHRFRRLLVTILDIKQAEAA